VMKIGERVCVDKQRRVVVMFRVVELCVECRNTVGRGNKLKFWGEGWFGVK
jgi:hypothetical protein